MCLSACISTLVVIAYERFRGIVLTKARLSLLNRRRALITIALIWALALLIASPMLFYRKHYKRVWKDYSEEWQVFSAKNIDHHK